MPPTIPPPPLSSFTANNHHQRTQSLQAQTTNSNEQIKRLPASTASPASPNSSSNTYVNILSPILSQIGTKHRHSTSSGSVEPKLDELKSAFFTLEQQHPGACDLFIKNIFSILKPAQTSSSGASNHH